MEPAERVAASSELPAGGSQSVGQISTDHLGAQSPYSTTQEQKQQRVETDGWDRPQTGGHSLQLEFQDSNLSPALSLLPGGEYNITEYSLFQQSDTEFAPLRAYPDVSVASERFQFSTQAHTTHISEHESLSQHPLAHETILSEEGASSCSLSQHSLSPGGQRKQSVIAHADEKQEILSVEDAQNREEDTTTHTSPSCNIVGEAAEDEIYFLRKDVPAQHLLDLLQKDVSVPSSRSSVVSSASEPSVKRAVSFREEATSRNDSKLATDQSLFRREGPPGEASLRQQTQQSDKSWAQSSEIANITMGSRSTEPDESSELLHRELLSEVQKRTNQERSPTPPVQVFTPYIKEMPEGKHVRWTGPFSAGVERLHREQDLWSSGNQTGIDGSYLGFLPQSQSTPGVFKAPSKSSVKAKLGHLSAIESNKENSYQSSTGVSSQPAPPVAEDRHLNTENQSQEDPTSAKVHSLPTLNYMQKVDAWRVNQSSGNTSLFDSLALQGFSGISPKKKAYDAVSDTLNRILSQRARSLQQPIVSGAVNKNVTQGSSTTPSGSSPRRGEAVGSAPSDKDNTGSAAAASPSPFGRSQSHSSLSTVLSIHKDQQTDKPSEKEKSQFDAGATVQPCPLMSLGQFSDVSLDQDTTLSSSQDSYSEMKLGTSVGASSGVSLELDHYAPYWTSKLSTPPPLPKPRELNIDELIPLYLHNLGIDQSPSTILTPFAPRGPIREPEFSPTDICTIKGSTPTKSTQPSEGSSPHKGECSRSSILSVDSSMSMSVSLDSLAPAVSVLERARPTSPPSDAEAIHSERRLAPSSLPDEDSPSYIPEQQDSSAANSQNMSKLGEDSFVSSKALLEIRKLLSQAENMISTGSSAASSSSPTAPRLLSDDDIFLSLRKSSRVQESSFSSSSNAEDPLSRSSRFWARSSSDSMLTSDKQRQSSIGQDTQQNVQDSTASSGAGVSLLLSNSARRTEPEGCSAAPPDKVPTQPLLINPSPVTATQQLTSTPIDTDGVPEEEDEIAHEGPEQSSSSSPITEDADQGGMSDVSSESSLAVRVAKLLQNESPATMVSSTPSVTDQEESKAREWIKLKVSGQQCEPLELDKEDRERIEEIKRELLLKNPIKSQGSTDTESSAASSVRVPWGHNPPHVSSDTNIQRTQLLQGLSVKLPDSSTQLQNDPRTDLEARVNEIAAKEGVTLSAQKPRPLTSITIATCRRSTSPSPSTSPAPPLSPTPEPLHLTELSTGPVKPPTTNRPLPSNLDEQDRVVLAQTQTRELSVTSQKRQDTMGGQLEKPVSPLQGLDQEDVTVTDESTNALRRDVAVGPGADQATSSGSPARTGHVSHVHLTLSPKTTEHPVTVSVHSSHADALSEREQHEHKDFVPLRHFSSAASSPDEGVGLSSPPEWCDTRVAVRQRAPERSDTSTMFKTPQPKGRTTTVSTSHHRSDMSSRCFNTETPVPVLLPYKPHGSEELFYVPQTEADVSSTEPSDTTMESSHTGSDDAVPPRFSSEVLGHQDPGLDRGVTIRHVEGIYSKRLKTATFKMQEPGCRDPPATVDQSAQTVTQTPKMSSHLAAAFTREPLPTIQEASRRDQGTSQVYFQPDDQPEPDLQTSGSQAGRESRGTGTLDQLWQRFCDQWATEESRPISDRETSLLERLERLSRLIHSSGASDVSEVREESDYPQEHRRRREDGPPRRKERKDFGEVMRSLHGEARKPEPVIHHRLQVEGRSQPAVDDSHTSSSFSHSSSHSLHFSPAERDESETLSTTSGSMSTVDTARLVRAFGAHRVQHLKTSSSLSKLYSTINKQREGREQRRGRNRDSPDTLTPPETSITDDSVAADSASSASTYILPSRMLASKKAVKLVNKGVQAGDLEIVSNGTRRHTRDVGTTFPSPGEGRAFKQATSSSASRARGGERSASKTQGTPKQRKSKRSPSKNYPEGISWFISADDLRSEARKENQEQETCRPSTAWFEPYSKTSPWREPLRQRQVHEDRNRRTNATRAEPDADPRTKPAPSGLARVSLQDALEMRRPEFISRSQQRVKCLNLQAEERRLQAVFNREREELFNQPGGPAARLLRPAGTAQVRRAVPRKEMIQRSKQIYENLPEVQRRKEEERRRAEYRSYRLNAQLYNKRITNRVLGRRSAWH